MKDCIVCVYSGDDLGRYNFGPSHPLGPRRLSVFQDELFRLELDRKVCPGKPVMAKADEIERFHTHEYIERVRSQSESGTGYLDYGDTPAFPGVYEAASFVVGTGLDALSRIMDGSCRRAFIPIAGLHHARRNSAGGFCVFNDCGVAIETLKSVCGLERIAYVDIDAHHADGVYYSFDADPAVIFADFHEDGRYLYPGTGDAGERGRGPGEGTKVNIPMPPFSDDEEFFRRWRPVEEFLRDGRPQFILFQCGADGLSDDPITQLNYSAAVHDHVTKRLCLLAEECCGGRLLALGGGGYNLSNIARAWTTVVRALIESPVIRA